MKTKRVLRYYCDFCGRSGGSAFHMKRHEECCTLNPMRKCGMCAISDDLHDHTLDELSVIVKTAKITVVPTDALYDCGYVSLSIENEDEVLKDLEIASNGCPACMLAAIRQSKYPEVFQSFNFKQRQKDFWDIINEVKNAYYRDH